MGSVTYRDAQCGTCASAMYITLAAPTVWPRDADMQSGRKLCMVIGVYRRVEETSIGLREEPAADGPASVRSITTSIVLSRARALRQTPAVSLRRKRPQQIKFVDPTRQVIGPRLDPALLQFQINGSQFSDIDGGERDRYWRRTVSHVSHSEHEQPLKELNITRINSRCHRDC